MPLSLCSTVGKRNRMSQAFVEEVGF